MRIFGFFVDADELAVEHEGLAGGDGGLALAARHAEDHVAVDILVGERGERLIVHDDDVRCRAGLQHAERVGEVFFTDLRVILEEHVRDLAPADVRQAVLAALGAEGNLEGLEHIVRVGVCAHAEKNAALVELEDGADADGVAHVGFRIVHDHRAGLLDDLHFGGVDVDAVAEDGLGTENAVILQALDGAAAVVLEGVVHIVHALGHVDVIARAAVVGRDHAVEGLIGDREQRVAAEHCREHRVLILFAFGDKIGVLLNGL